MCHSVSPDNIFLFYGLLSGLGILAVTWVSTTCCFPLLLVAGPTQVSSPSSEAKAAPKPKGPFAKKGKGPPLPGQAGKGPPEADTSPAASAPEEQAAAEGAKAAGPPGKKGGKGPPLPGHKAAGAAAEAAEGHPTPSADEPKTSPEVPKIKGPGKKGGKGPPLPGAKAPADAEPAKDAPPTPESSAKGKGPPPPGGKGPSNLALKTPIYPRPQSRNLASALEFGEDLRPGWE